MAGEGISRKVPGEDSKPDQQKFEDAANKPNNPSNGLSGKKDYRSGGLYAEGDSYNPYENYCDHDDDTR